MKKIVFLIGIAAILLLPFSTVDATPTPELTPEEAVDEKIKEIRESVRKQVEEKIDQILSDQKKIAWAGTIKEKGETSLALTTRRGEREVIFSDETVIVNQQSQKKTLEDLSEGKRVAALGYQQSENILEAKRIIIITNTSVEKMGLVGIISDKSTVDQLIAVAPVNDKDQVIEVAIQKQTSFIDGKEKPATYDNLEKGQKIAVVYEKEEEKNNALLIRVLGSNQVSPSPQPETEE